ncbi:MAG: hypothetical protein ABI761_18735 [Saprospiraceae bacterium]
MKTEDDKLNDFFKKQMKEEINGIPDFEQMWQKAMTRRKSKPRLVWKIAASIALLATVGLAVTKNRQDQKADNIKQITSWNEPSKSLIPPPGSDLMVLSRWASPTNFLLPKNKQ